MHFSCCFHVCLRFLSTGSLFSFWCVFDLFDLIHLHTICMRFSFDPLSRTFSNPRCIFDKKTLGALGAVHTNPGKFETTSFLLESAFRPQETSESSHRNRIFCGGLFEQLARYTTRDQESDLHLAFILLNLLTTSAYTTSTLLFLLFSTH